MALTDQGKKRFNKQRAAAGPAIAALADNAARHMFDKWANGQDAALRPLENRFNEFLERFDDVTGADEQELFTHVGDIEEYAFIVGFETARRLMGGAR